MAGPYYVDSTATGGSNTGGSWANAFLTFAQAVTAATTANDIIYVSHAHSESLSADTTYTFSADVRVFCVNSGTGALAKTALIGAQSASYLLALAGAYEVYLYGIVLKNGTDSTSKRIEVATTDGGHFELEQCTLWSGSTSANSYFRFGLSGTAPNCFAKFKACEFRFGAAAQSINVAGGLAEFIDCTVSASYTKPTNLFATSWGGNARIICAGCDWSWNATNLVSNTGSNGFISVQMSNCKLGTGVVALQASTSIHNRGQTDLLLLNCASDDTHYALGHYDSFGQTTVSATIYANDGAKYDGTNRCSWKIVTTAHCSYYTPYVSPWVDKYHDGTSAITPRLEILRDGSATAYRDDEVWGEWSYQGTSGSTKATIVSDRMTPLGTAADQTASSLGAGDWTGENATAWFGKLTPTSAITPAEIGHIRARVCVGEPSITVYVDPQIRDDGTAGSGRSRVTPSGWIDTVASSGAHARFGDRTGGLR